MVAEKLNRGIFRGKLSGECSIESKSARVMGEGSGGLLSRQNVY